MIDVSINRFHEGVDYDSSELDLSNTKARELVNARIMNVNGQGFVAVPYGSTQQQFSLSQGFYPIGACTYNGIAYIFSRNDLGVGEIGTFPSPLWGQTFGDPCGPGWSNTYSPLFNFLSSNTQPTDSDTRDPFSTDLLVLSDQIECFARIDFDNSVNIYFTDGVNPVRKINSGFDQQGNCNSRNYFNGSFPGAINLLTSTCQIPQFGDMSLSSGGNLKYGNHFLAIRYVTDTDTKGDFVEYSLPIQVQNGVDSNGYITYGGHGNEPFNISSNKLTIGINNLDTGFKFFEIAVVRFFNDTYESYLIDNLYEITNQSETITITGSEPSIDVSIDEILSSRTIYDVAKTIAQVQNRLFRGNLSESRPWDQRLVDLSRAIVARPSSDPLGIPGFGIYKFGEDNPYTPTSNRAGSDETGYHQSQKTYGDVGYFRSEPYQFGIVFKYKDGKESPPFPVRGYDAWFNPGPAALTDYNYDGVLRMPSNHQSQYVDMQGTQMRTRALGVVFNWFTQDPNNGFQTADDIYNDNIDFFTNQICGWYYVRSERKPTIDFQGPIHGTYAIGDNSNANPLLYGDLDNYSSGQVFPSPGTNDIDINDFDTGIIPMINYRVPGSGITKPLVPARWGTSENFTFILNNAPYYNYTRSNKYGVFSSDHFFNSSFIPGLKNIIIQNYYNCDAEFKNSLSVARTPLGPEDDPGSIAAEYWRIYPNFIWDHINTVSLDEPTGGIVANTRSVGQVGEINPGTTSGEFRSYFREGELFSTDPTSTSGNIPFLLFLVGLNREIHTRKYLSVSYDTLNPNHIVPNESDIHPDFIPLDADHGRAIVNIYKIDPRPVSSGGGFDINNWYSFRTNTFYKITDIQTSPGGGWEGNGDCFIQRTYFKEVQSRSYSNNIDVDKSIWHTSAIGGSTVAENRQRYICYGNMYSIVTENSINTAMRNLELDLSGNIANDFYPRSNTDQPFNFMGFDRRQESALYNDGYTRVLPPKGLAGADPQFPPTGKRLETRIDFSEFHSNSSIADNYSYIKPSNYQDYSYNYGPIVKIGEINGELYSVQNSCASQHFVNERNALTSESGNSVIVGNGDILSPKQRVLFDGVGSQHQFSIVQSDRFVYGVDAFKRKIWRFNLGSAEIISDSKAAKSKMRQILDAALGTTTNISNQIQDSPAIDFGINSYFDRKYNEIGFSVFADDPTVRDRTIVFKEEMDFFQGENTYNSHYYITLNNNLISFDPDNKNVAYFHDIVFGDCLLFYSRQNPDIMEVQFIVNDKNFATKIFDNLEFGTNGRPFLNIRIDTEDQVAKKNWIDNLAYADPVWKENKWKLPVPRTTAIQSPNNNIGTQNQYFINSRIRGKWMRVTIRYRRNDYQYISDVISKYRISRT